MMQKGGGCRFKNNIPAFIRPLIHQNSENQATFFVDISFLLLKLTLLPVHQIRDLNSNAKIIIV